MKIPENLLYKEGRLHMDGWSLEELAEKYGTPLYVYSQAMVQNSMAALRRGLGDRAGMICFAVKSNSNLEILRTIRAAGGGADIVSGGELFRALKAGVDPAKILYSGVGKTEREIREALAADILLFVVESEGELREISRLAQDMGRTARISVRVNPDVDAGTHPYISTGLKENKFGVSHKYAMDVYRLARELPGVEPQALGFHIGSQLTELAPFQEAADIINELAREAIELGVDLKYVDVGGGLGITYRGDENPPSPEEYVRTIVERISLPGVTLIFEPGRSLVGRAGVLLTRILYEKNNEGKNFYIGDTAMNDLLRPALYQAHHEVLAADESRVLDEHESDLVGPICETGDFLAKDRRLPGFRPGDLAVLTSAGAYGFVMSSNYNSRPRAAEVLIREDGEDVLIRARETYEDLLRGEPL